jgi:hypothetical protein
MHCFYHHRQQMCQTLVNLRDVQLPPRPVQQQPGIVVRWRSPETSSAATASGGGGGRRGFQGEPLLAKQSTDTVGGWHFLHHGAPEVVPPSEREAYTEAMLQAFLEFQGAGEGGGGLPPPSRHYTGRSGPARGGRGGWRGSGSRRGNGEERRELQGEVVAHVLAGDFDEAFLQRVPTHTLNWAIKVSRRARQGQCS